MPTYRSNLYQYEPNKIEIKPYKIVLKAPNFLIFLTLPVIKKKIMVPGLLDNFQNILVVNKIILNVRYLHQEKI